MTDTALTIAISSTALFDLSESDDIYRNEGLEAYRQYQIEHEDILLTPGEGFPLVTKLLNINKLLNKSKVEVLLLSRNSADTGLRVFNSIRHFELDITRAAFCGGLSPYRYVRAFNCDLFLSTDAEDVRQALDENVAAARLLAQANSNRTSNVVDEPLRLAFDGDSVLFSDEAERVYQADGLVAFSQS